MRFLAAMGVDTRVVIWLRQKGHDAKHLRDEGLQRIPNGEIFAKAISEKRVILTLDLDFAEIVALSKGQKASVILFRLYNTRTSHLISRLSTVLSECRPPGPSQSRERWNLTFYHCIHLIGQGFKDG